MANPDTDTIEQVNKVKQKLIKYSEKKLDTEKVSEYLKLLATFEVNYEILKETNIYKVVKELKKKENEKFSRKAGELLIQFKNQSGHSSESNCKYEPIKSEPDYIPSKKVSSVKQEKSEPSLSKSGSKLSDGEKHKGKKRTSEIGSEQLRSEKKSKLSLLDYKKNHTIVDSFDIFEANTNYENEESNEGSKTNEYEKSNQYMGSCDEEESSEYQPSLMRKETNADQNPSKLEEKNKSSEFKNDYKSKVRDHDTSYEPTSKQTISQSSSVKIEPYVPASSSAKPQKNITYPPTPSVSLQDLFGESSSRAEPYEPTSTAKPATNLPRAASSIRGPSSFTPVNSLERDKQTAAEVDAALSQIMRNKQSKRMIYTGKKTNGFDKPVVKKLFDLCVRTLVDNLETFPSKISQYNRTHEFAIPFELVKPVLEKTNAKQLENIEYHSPHLLSDTDYIWKKISEHEFKRIEPPDDDESWRELYFKKLDERELHFQRARSLISNKQKNKPAERVTQIATIKYSTKSQVYMGPKSLNGVRPSGKMSNRSEVASTGYTKSAPKVVDHSFRKPTPAQIRAQPVMSQGMRAISKMMRTRRK